VAPMGRSDNPAQFRDRIYFSVRNMSLGGMQFVCSTRNRTLLPGLELQALLSFPAGDQVPVRFVVSHVRPLLSAEQPRLAVGARFTQLSDRANRAIANYVLRFSAAPPRSLAEAGFMLRSVRSAVDYGFAETDEDYDEVVALRRLA